MKNQEAPLKKTKIGYVLRKFPVLSETFILNEMLELEAQGADLHIISVEKPNAARYHENLHRLKAEISYVPDLLEWKSLLNQRKRAKKQFAKGYSNCFKYVFKEFNPSLMLRFLQSCYVCNLAKKEGITHFHAHFATRATTVACLSSMICNIPYSFTAHAVDIFKNSLSKKALYEKMSRASHVVTVSEFNRNYLLESFPEAKEKLHKIYNGIHLDRFSPAPKRNQNPFTFLCVARLVEKKGHPFLIEACKILKNQKIPFRCQLIGAGPLKSEIEKMIRERDLEDVVQILGSQTQTEVLKKFHDVQAYILTCTTSKNGDKDGLPVAMVEALACGLPVITTPMTGNPEVVQDGHNGFLVPFENPEKTAEAMRKLINDHPTYEAFCENARRSVENNFDIKQTTKTLMKYFK